MTQVTRDRLTVAREKLAARPPRLPALDVKELRGRWDAMSVDERRVVLASCLHEITVRAPLKKGANRFDESRIGIVFSTKQLNDAFANTLRAGRIR